ncbi:hypothetical protein K2Y11_03875 [bacterium]|nr:hypothetical protein [bacterium]
MTPTKNEELLDELIDRHRSGESIESILAQLPADFSLPELSVRESRQLVADLVILDENVGCMPRPVPSSNFAEGVMAALREPTVTAAQKPTSTWRVVGATAAAAIAATLLFAVTLNPKDFTKESKEVASAPVAVDPAQVSMNDAVRQGTEATLELFQEIASNIPADNRTPDEKKEVQLASATPIGRAIQGSSTTIKTAGQGLRVSVEPITNTALDAFGFLWRPAGAEDSKQPSI